MNYVLREFPPHRFCPRWHRVVGCSIASSHEDFHAVASIPSRADPNSQKCLSKYCIIRDECLLGVPTDNHVSFSSINSSNSFQLPDCRMFHPPIFNMDRSATTFGSILAPITKFFTNFGIQHAVLHQFFIHHDVLNQFFIHHDLRVTFPSFQLFSSIRIFGIFFQIFPSRALRHDMPSTLVHSMETFQFEISILPKDIGKNA